MTKRGWISSAVLAGACLWSSAAFAGADLKVDRIRGYFIYSNNAELSENMQPKFATDQLYVGDPAKGTALQMLMDVIVAAPKGFLAGDGEDQPFLNITAKDSFDDTLPPYVEKSYPIAFIDEKAKQTVFSVIVDFNCSSFKINAVLMQGKKKLSEKSEEVSITCGD